MEPTNDLFEDSFHPTFPDNTNATDEENDDFDFLQGQTKDQDDNYWISQQQVEEVTSRVGGDYPDATNWKNDHPSMIEKTKVSIDKARRNLWKQAKTEIGIVRSVWEDEFHPSFDKLA